MSFEVIVQNLKKSFDNKMVLKGVDLSVKAGESVVVIGGSGSGKSVLLKCLIGLMIPDKDSKVLFNNEDYTLIPISKREDFLDKFGMLFQGGALFDSLQIWENICFRLIRSGKISRLDAYDYAVEQLGLVGLKPEVANLYPSELSGGMQKRAALARAIAAKPSLIFFDEPTAGLDPIMSTVISTLISDLSKKLKATTITITHDMKCVGIVADQVAMIYEGTVIWQGDKSDLYNTKNSIIDNFVHGHMPIVKDSK